MRTILFATLSLVGVFLLGLAPAYGQNAPTQGGGPGVWGAAPYGHKEVHLDSSQLTVINSSPVVKGVQAARVAAALAAGLTPEAGGPRPLAPSLQVWPYTFVSPRDGNTYSGTIVGASPFNRGARVTNVPVVIVPVRVQFTGTVRNFDPTSPDNGCLGTGNTALSLTEQSPILTPTSYTINGVSEGMVTFPDAFQRASFFPQVSTAATAWHLGLPYTVAATQTISVVNGTSNGATYTISGDCSTNTTAMDNPPRLGVLDINFVDPILQGFITSLGINASQFPLFLIYGVVMSDGSAIIPGLPNCCILGYHNETVMVPTPTNFGTSYGIAEYDQGYIFGGTEDISVLSHEVLEWVNDPSTVNLVPRWGSIGQVPVCTADPTTGQDNLEVGDPLSGKLMPGVLMPNGVTYHAQELAFFGWFLGNFAGAGGKYSSNGTFGGDAKNCPPGGTN